MDNKKEIEPTKIIVKKNGPLVVIGEHTFTYDDIEHDKKPRTSFCRCGQSKLQPFCDGTHKEIDPFE